MRLRGRFSTARPSWARWRSMSIHDSTRPGKGKLQGESKCFACCTVAVTCLRFGRPIWAKRATLAMVDLA